MSVLAPYCSQAPAVADEAPAAHQGGGGMATEPNEAPDSDQDDDAPEIADESDCESLLVSDEDPEQEGEEEEGSGASGGKGSSSRGGKGGGKGRGGGKASGGGGSGLELDASNASAGHATTSVPWPWNEPVLPWRPTAEGAVPGAVGRLEHQHRRIHGQERYQDLLSGLL